MTKIDKIVLPIYVNMSFRDKSMNILVTICAKSTICTKKAGQGKVPDPLTIRFLVNYLLTKLLAESP